MRAARPFLAAALLGAVLPATLAQGGQNVVQNGTALSLALNFDVAKSGVPYPPPRFPAYYPATNLAKSTLPLNVYNARPKAWALTVRALPFEPGGPLLDQVEYRVNGGAWTQMSSAQIVALGREVGWQHYDVEFRLRLQGHEAPGTFQTALTWQLAPQ